jgi:hypothetical protein
MEGNIRTLGAVEVVVVVVVEIQLRGKFDSIAWYTLMHKITAHVLLSIS